MTRSFLNTTSRHALRALAAASLFALASAAHAAVPPVPGFPSFAAIGDVSNYTNPGVWEHHGVDVTAWVAGASSAQLSFDFANDLEGTGSTSTNAPTNAHLYFASDSGSYFLNFEYFRPLDDPFANSSSHLRDVRLVIDGVSFADQFGAFSNHLGNALLGTAGDGDGEGYNILGQSGFEARTYTLTPAVPEPETWALMLGGIGWMWSVKRRRTPQAR